MDFRNRFKDNLILIQLRFPVSFSNGVCPICLPKKEIIQVTNKGFQIQNSNNIESKKAELHTVACANLYPNVSINYDEMFCARYTDLRFRGMKGAPIQSFEENKLRIIGVTAVSQPKKEVVSIVAPQPALFTKIYPFVSWIESVVWAEEL